MFDLWLDEAELTRLTLLVAVTVLLPLQLLLCCRVRSRLSVCCRRWRWALSRRSFCSSPRSAPAGWRWAMPCSPLSPR